MHAHLHAKEARDNERPLHAHIVAAPARSCNLVPLRQCTSVKLDLPRRVALFCTAIVAVSAVLGWRAWVAWRETGRLATLGPALEEGQQLADHYKAEVLELNHALARYGITGLVHERERFTGIRQRLRTWLHDQARLAPADADSSVLRRIRQAFDAYETHADRLLAAREAEGPGLDPRQLIDQLEKDSVALLAFASELDQLHRAELNRYLSDAEQAVATLHNFTLGSLTTLLALVGCAGVFVWRDLIAPLRSRLIESRLALEQREKLASLGVLAAGVAHEVRNPLTSMKARAFTLTRLLSPGTPEHGDARVIGSEIARLERIVDDFLRFSRPSPPQPALMQAPTLLSDLARFISPDLEKRQIRLLIGTVDDTPFPADAAQLRQVLLNLIRNAIDAAPGGTITLTAERGQVRIQRQMTPVMSLAVSDTGPGIPPDVQRRLFDPFFTTKASGAGLGLSISARIVEGHGGTLGYQTTPGRGTTFTVHLPLVAQPLAEHPTAAPAQKHLTATAS